MATTQQAVLTQLERELVDYATQIVRYYRDSAWALDQERVAQESTDGNVTALEAIAMGLDTRLQQLFKNVL